MDDKIIIAIIAAISAILGGIVMRLLNPMIKHRMEVATTEKARKREQIAKWRQMLLDVDCNIKENAGPGEILQIHPDYISLEPYLTDKARRVVQGSDRTIVVGQTLSHPLEVLKHEIARIEAEWGLRR